MMRPENYSLIAERSSNGIPDMKTNINQTKALHPNPDKK